MIDIKKTEDWHYKTLHCKPFDLLNRTKNEILSADGSRVILSRSQHTLTAGRAFLSFLKRLQEF